MRPFVLKNGLYGFKRGGKSTSTGRVLMICGLIHFSSLSPADILLIKSTRAHCSPLLPFLSSSTVKSEINWSVKLSSGRVLEPMKMHAPACVFENWSLS
jgi:hypothetical protein